MFSPLQAQWSHTVSWTVRSCGIPPSPPLKKETLTCGSTRAHHSTCTVLPRSGSRIKRLFCITWSLLDVLKNNYVPFLILYNVSWMNSLTKVYSSIENFWYQHWGFQTSIKFSFHLWKLNIDWVTIELICFYSPSYEYIICSVLFDHCHNLHMTDCPTI